MVLATTATDMQCELPVSDLLERNVWADFGLRAEDLQGFITYIRVRDLAFADKLDTWFCTAPAGT